MPVNTKRIHKTESQTVGRDMLPNFGSCTRKSKNIYDDIYKCPEEKKEAYRHKVWMDWDKWDFLQWFRKFHFHLGDMKLVLEHEIDGSKMEPLLQFCMDFVRKIKKDWETELPENPVKGLSSSAILSINTNFWKMAVSDLKECNNSRK